MINKFFGIEYDRGATAQLVKNGPSLAPKTVKTMFPDSDWTIINSIPVDIELWSQDRFGENLSIQTSVYNSTPRERHIMIGGDHSLDFGHFAAIANNIQSDDICLIYVDAHLDAHTPESSKNEASGAPHGSNVRALCGDGDPRWLKLLKKSPVLKPENVFYLASRSYEPSEIQFIRDNNIYMKTQDEMKTIQDLKNIVDEIREKIGNRPYILSFDFDSIDPKYFKDVLVPEPNGITSETAEFLLKSFSNALSFEFVEYAPSGDQSSAEIAHRLIDIARQS